MDRGGNCDRADLPPGALRMSEPKLRPLKSTARNHCATSKKREAQEAAAAAAGWLRSQRYIGERREGGASSAPTRERRTGEEAGHPFLRQGKLESGRYVDLASGSTNWKKLCRLLPGRISSPSGRF